MARRPRTRLHRCWLLVPFVLLGATAGAIETDQFYAWDRTIEDATDMLNAKFNLELSRVLDEVNARSGSRAPSCHDVRKRIAAHFRLLIFHDLELWAINTSLVDRVPATLEGERAYRREYLYRDHSGIDFISWMPPSPTLELNGVRIGADKLTHFTSEGWWYFRWYHKARTRGRSVEQAERKAIRRGLFTERTILGMGASGVLSLADLEANYRGMRFYIELCEGDAPLLVHERDGWAQRAPFDFRDHVTPEWDESYQPSIFGKGRWEKVRPVMLDYCPLLDLPAVRHRREDYARRDGHTATERRVGELVERGKLPDPRRFSIEHACGRALENVRPAPTDSVDARSVSAGLARSSRDVTGDGRPAERKRP